MSNENPTTSEITYTDEPDFGVWSRAVDRVVDALDLDWYPSEALVVETVAELGLTDPDEDDQMDQLEDELITILGE
ncbi:hypothetical protein SEA_MILANI_34 [Microbacterium phage Milani]|nr:hypothetical protein SEA_MILANI_34 [Microbacterium phage Milani]